MPAEPKKLKRINFLDEHEKEEVGNAVNGGLEVDSFALSHVPDNCWDAGVTDRKYGIGFDRREGPGFLYSEGTYMHEGSGSCSVVIDPVEQLAAAWFVPFRPGEWYADGLWNVSNIIWSGLI